MSIKDYLRLIKNFISYYFYVYRTRNVDFFDYEKLARPYAIFAGLTLKPGLLGNKCYGNWKAIKTAMGDKLDPHNMIEHGIYFGRRILFEECEMSEISTIYTYSPYRLEVLKEHYQGKLGKKVVAVGSYIKYAQNFHSEVELKALKQKYGKILLVFPSHPDPSNDTVYDFEEFMREIDRVGKDYDSIFVSMYWVDIVNGKHKIYKDKGYTIVCSGNRFDPRFLSRQKDLIELSDMTMSNDLGTHVGYSVALNRPHYMFKQKVELNLVKEDAKIVAELRKTRSDFDNEHDLIQKAFGEYRQVITEEQRKLVAFYWGDKVEPEIEI